jgi:hypothetical protein
MAPESASPGACAGWHHQAMDSGARVCPFCGELPGAGVFCVACGHNLAGVQRLPTRAQWAAGESAVADGGPAPIPAPADPRPLAERCAEATATFLATMHAAGDPGATETPVVNRSTLRRTPKVTGWVIRPVDRDDDSTPRRYVPGLVLATDGTFHQLDSELRGWGQRDFPQYHHTVGTEPIAMPVEERLLSDLAGVLEAARAA